MVSAENSNVKLESSEYLTFPQPEPKTMQLSMNKTMV
jgi:hypothetical protein